MDIENVIHIYNVILFICKKKMKSAGKWIELGKVIANEVILAQSDKCHVFPHKQIFRFVYFIWSTCRSQGARKGSWGALRGGALKGN